MIIYIDNLSLELRISSLDIHMYLIELTLINTHTEETIGGSLHWHEYSLISLDSKIERYIREKINSEGFQLHP